jgi:hypothetical protein
MVGLAELRDREPEVVLTELLQDAATEHLALRREPAALCVGEAQAPAAELLAQDAVLLPEVFEDLDLAAVHPAASTRSKN